MGLIDSTNAVGRELRTQRQIKEAERQARRIEREAKLQSDGAKAHALEELKSYISDIYEKLGYTAAHNYFLSIDARARAINTCADDELTRGYCVSLYDKALREIDIIYKKNEEYLANLPPSQSERQKQARHDMAQALAGVILAFIKVVGRTLMLVVLVFIGFDKLASGVCKKKKRYR